MKLCLSHGYWKDSSLYKNLEDKTICRSFEQFCNHILRMDVPACVTQSTSKNSKYYLLDCLCDSPMSSCSDETLHSKAISYVSQFPCIPLNKDLPQLHLVTLGELWDIHRKLVQEYNEMVDTYNHCIGDSVYLHISPIK